MLSSYFYRKEIAMSEKLHKLYPGDCGATEGSQITVREDLSEKLLGRYVIAGDGALVHLTEENIQQYLGDTMITVRSPIYCKYTDGVCQICFGTIGHDRFFRKEIR